MLVFTVLSRTPELAKMAERLGVIDGQPFLIGEDGTFDRDVNTFLRSLVDPSRPGRNTWRTWGLTLSGTKTHVKQRCLPLTPLLMVSDVLWSHQFCQREGIMAEHIDMSVAKRGEACDIFIIRGFTLRPEMIQGCLHINSVP